MSDHRDLLDTWIQDLGFNQPDLPWKVYASKAELRDLVRAARGIGLNKGHENALADAERNFQAGVRKGQQDALAATDDFLHDDPCDCDQCLVILRVRNRLREVMHDYPTKEVSE